MDSKQELLRSIPKIDDMLRMEPLEQAAADHGHAPVLEAVRSELDGLRAELLEGRRQQAATAQEMAGRVLDRLARESLPSLRPVINATGVILHTNLGRAVLCEEAAQAASQVARGYSTLEYDCESGRRGSRYSHVERLLCQICGVESAMVVNNNAAAVLLVLGTMARGGEVVVSRGELVEIGGSFRVPEIMEQSGGVLREVGTTNKTHRSDYEQAVGEQTKALLKVHTSNYKIMGFFEEVSCAELAQVAHDSGLPLIYDLGSGALFDPGRYGLRDEPDVLGAVRDGADVVSFSGDKLLGGPQAGVIIGKREYIERMKKNPLTRAFRVDKMTLAALEATLRVYLDPALAAEKIPTLRMLSQDRDTLLRRARSLARRLRGIDGLDIQVTDEQGQVGGGSVPTEMIDTVAVSLFSQRLSVSELEARLRRRDVPIVARVAKNRLILDMLTVQDGQLGEVAAALRQILD